MHQLPKICIPPSTDYAEAYIDNTVLYLNSLQYIDLSMINHHYIITRCVDELFVLLYLHNERRLKLIQSFTKKALNCRCVLHIKTVSEDDAKWLLKKMMKWFHLSNVDYKRVCAYGMAGEYNNIVLSSDVVDEGVPLADQMSQASEATSQVLSTNASMSTQSIQTHSSNFSLRSLSSRSLTNIPYKRSKSDSTTQPRHTNLVCFSGQKSLHQERSIASLSENVKPPFLRSISSPNQQELDRCRSIAL